MSDNLAVWSSDKRAISAAFSSNMLLQSEGNWHCYYIGEGNSQQLAF